MIKTLKTQRLELKSITPEDKPELTELLLNEEIKKTYMIPDFPDEASLERMRNVFIRYSAAEDHFTRGIYRKGRLIGFVNDVEIKDDQIELGYVIHPAFWGRGYATEMLRAVMDELLSMGFSAIRAGAFSENLASLRVMEKCGMVRCPQTEQIEYRGKVHRCTYYELSEKGIRLRDIK